MLLKAKVNGSELVKRKTFSVVIVTIVVAVVSGWYFVIPKGPPLTLYLRDAVTGQPVADATISISDNPQGGPFSFFGESRTDSEGKIVVSEYYFESPYWSEGDLVYLHVHGYTPKTWIVQSGTWIIDLYPTQ